MALKPEHDGDITKVPGARILVSRNKPAGEFVGLYGFCSEGTLIRYQGSWITATGVALQKFNDTKVTHMTPEFIDVFDKLDVKGAIPSDEEIAAYVDHSYDLPKTPAK